MGPGQSWPRATDRRAHEEKVVVFWLGAEVLEDALLPVALHLVPVLCKQIGRAHV